MSVDQSAPQVPNVPKHYRGDMWQLWDTWGRRNGAVLVITVNATQVSRDDGRRLTPGERFGPMGKGCALEAVRRHPELQRWWSDKLALGEYGGLWHCTPLNPDPDEPSLDRRVGLLVTKINWWDRSTYALVEQGLEQLRWWADDAEKAGRDRFVLPLPGAGYGGLDPERVKSLCRKHLDDRFAVCTPV
jgi:hypothetical protein